MPLTEQSMHCAAAHMHACMHSSPFIERRPQSGSLIRSSISVRASRIAFSSSLEFGYVRLGLSFPSPTRFRPHRYAYNGGQRRHRSSISHPLPGKHVEHSFCKARQLSSPCDYFEKRRQPQQQDDFFSAPNRQSVRFILPGPHFSKLVSVQQVS